MLSFNILFTTLQSEFYLGFWHIQLSSLTRKQFKKNIVQKLPHLMVKLCSAFKCMVHSSTSLIQAHIATTVGAGYQKATVTDLLLRFCTGSQGKHVGAIVPCRHLQFEDGGLTLTCHGPATMTCQYVTVTCINKSKSLHLCARLLCKVTIHQ